MLTHHPVPLQFVDQRRQTATGRFAFSIHHLKQAAGHSAFHHCSTTKPCWNTNQPPNQLFQVALLPELLRTDLHVMHRKCPRRRAPRGSFASPAPAAYPDSPPVSQVCREAKQCQKSTADKFCRVHARPSFSLCLTSTHKNYCVEKGVCNNRQRKG